MNRHMQCKIEKSYQISVDGTVGKGGSFLEEEICWLPERFAQIGTSIEIRNGGWNDGWKVTEVYKPAMASKWIAERTQDHKNMKKMTDI